MHFESFTCDFGIVLFPYFIFYLDTDDCEQCTKTLEELENIDDDCDRHGITFVKTKDFSVAEQYGVHDFPALVYFENSIPNVFEGKIYLVFFFFVFVWSSILRCGFTSI